MADKLLLVVIDDETLFTRSILSQLRRAGRYDGVVISTAEELFAFLLRSGNAEREYGVFI